MKRSLRSLLAGIVLFSFLAMGCGGGGGGGTVSDTTPASNNNSYYSNPTDSRIITIVDEEDRSTYTYNGDIDTDGQIIKLTSIVVKDPDLEEDIVYFLNEESFPAMIHTSEFTFALEPVSNAVVRLTAISTLGEVMVNMPVELDTGGEAGVSEISMEETMPSAIKSQAQSSAANMYATLTKCGKLVENAAISVNIDPKIGTSNPVGTHVGDGQYAFHIPSTVEGMLKKCDAIPDKMASFCVKAALIPTSIKTCNQLASVVGLISSDYAKSVQKYCKPALLKHLPKIKTILCDEKMRNEIKNVCKWNVIMDIPEESHSFSFSVKIPGSKTFTTETVPFSPNMKSVSAWEITAPYEISLDKLYIVPSDPESDEWYTAHASMVCPDPDYGTTVTLSVQGSEGYKNSVEEVMKVNSTISLDVPPASDSEKDVIDKITVSAEGQTWSMKTMADDTRTWTMVVQRAADATNDDDITTWYVWYVDNMGLKPVMVGTKKEFEEDRLCSSYPGGGTDPNLLMDKVPIVEAYATEESAIAAACSQFTDIIRVPGSSTFIFTDWIGYLDGERHDIDELDGCQ